MLMDYPAIPQQQNSSFYQFRDRKKSCDSDEFRKRSNTIGSVRSTEKRWPKRDMGPQFELRCCVDNELLRNNVDRQYYFEDETVRVNGSVFHKRTDYENLLSVIPKSKFNGIHIKMEDDCPQGGDDVRLCLLKTLGAHNQRHVECILCHDKLKVYDKYPLIDGTFYVSPVCQTDTKTEISIDGKRYYLQQICVKCLWANWKCTICGRDDWFNGKSTVLGTLYYYDILAAWRCCELRCLSCHKTLDYGSLNVLPKLLAGGYTLITFKSNCHQCMAHDYHLIREVSTMEPVEN